ncbi:MAG TPA: hypothetical protein DGH68_02140 [Bacteroidetes bacterium]|nr:hypothetical protein [Bacteroidota bacterium]
MESANKHITIKVSYDGFDAQVYDDGSHSRVDADEIKQMLVKSGVVYGVLETSLKAIVEGQLNGQPLIVAQGTRSVNGEDGWVEYFFDHEKAKPVEEKSGKVNLHEMHFIHNVRQGERLALVHLPTPGVPGTTVTGRTISAKEGKKAVVHPGPYTKFSPDDPLTVIASTDGSVVLKFDGTIEVHPSLIIGGNVDFATGNVDFVGSVKVAGDIKSDFSVKTQKDLEVGGNVEDAQVEVGGELKIQKGFIGVGKGVLKAKGNVTVQHILNQTIISEKDILIEKESVNGNLRAGGKIVSMNGTIAGGRLEADEEIEVMNLGSGEHSQARLRVGRKGRTIERLAQLEKELQQAQKQVSDVRDGVYRLIRMKLDSGILPPEKEQMLTKLQEVQKLLPGRLESLQQEKGRLTEELKQDCKARVIVHGTVLENVLIEINGVRKVVETALQDVIFIERAGVIEVRSP